MPFWNKILRILMITQSCFKCLSSQWQNFVTQLRKHIINILRMLYQNGIKHFFRSVWEKSTLHRLFGCMVLPLIIFVYHPHYSLHQYYQNQHNHDQLDAVLSSELGSQAQSLLAEYSQPGVLEQAIIGFNHYHICHSYQQDHCNHHQPNRQR